MNPIEVGDVLGLVLTAAAVVVAVLAIVGRIAEMGQDWRVRPWRKRKAQFARFEEAFFGQ